MTVPTMSLREVINIMTLSATAGDGIGHMLFICGSCHALFRWAASLMTNSTKSSINLQSYGCFY